MPRVVELDTFASGLFGKGKVHLTVIPDFPFAPPCAVSTPVEFNNPLDVTGASPGKVLLDYDASKFRPFDDEQLWLEPPTKKGTQRSKQQKTPKDLATAIASQELRGTPTRAPHFGSISTLGKRVRIRGQVTRPDACLWEEHARVPPLRVLRGDA